MKKKDTRKIIEANREGWDKAEPFHRTAKLNDLKKSFEKKDFIYINGIAFKIFQLIGIKKKSVVQLMCNNGRELLSLKRLGAGRCVGVDFSESFLKQAHELAELTGLESEFICADVLQTPVSLYSNFDIVFITSGSLRWVPDLGRLFEKVKLLLRPGGHFIMTEMHPVLNILDDSKDQAILKNSYFRSEPFLQTEGLDYWTDQPYNSPPVYHFQHTLGEIIGQCLNHGMQLRHFHEHAMDLSGGRYSRQEPRVFPLSFSLIAQTAK